MGDNGRSLLILDLDETLVSGRSLDPRESPEGPWPSYDFFVPLGPDRRGVDPSKTVRVRPGAGEFLVVVRSLFDDIAVWTASGEGYAAEVVRRVFPEGYPLAFVWSSERCGRFYDSELQTAHEGVKNLSKVRREGWPIERMLIVDDSPEKLVRQPTSLVQIAPWRGEGDDGELARVLRALKAAVLGDDFRHWRRRLGEARAEVDRYGAPDWFFSPSRDRGLPRGRRLD